jgi:beta-1,4-mannooligosaccharide/beta-1,4-mannosyl-N-acetylglucosamine phosphorylase
MEILQTYRVSLAPAYQQGILQRHPERVIAAPRQFILQPETIYECIGQVPNVVFTNGAVVMPDGMLNIYYGGADTRGCLAQVPLDELVEFCVANG